LNAFSNVSSAFSQAISLAFSMKRLDSSLSSDFGFVFPIRPHLWMSCLIGKPLADDTAKDLFGSLLILAVNGNAVIIAEIELRQIALQMPFGAMLIGTLHAALEDAEIAFDAIGVNIVTRHSPAL